jgi:hypothetical protein
VDRRADEDSPTRANSKRRRGSGRPIESVSAKAGKYLGANFEPLTPAENRDRRDQANRSETHQERVQRTAMAGDAAVREAMMHRVVDAAVRVPMFAGIGVVIGRVLNSGMPGGGSHACLGRSMFQRDDAGELSDHEQADQKRNYAPKVPKPLHRISSLCPEAVWTRPDAPSTSPSGLRRRRLIPSGRADLGYRTHAGHDLRLIWIKMGKSIGL